MLTYKIVIFRNFTQKYKVEIEKRMLEKTAENDITIFHET